MGEQGNDDRTPQPGRLRFEGHSSSLVQLLPSGADPSEAPPVTLTFPPGLELLTDVSSAAWAEERLLERPFARVGALVPDAFQDYARVLHPAYIRVEGRREEAVTWAKVAARMGRVAHPLMQFARITELGTNANAQPSWGRRPELGYLPDDVVEPLVRILEEFTATPKRCYFCLWDGFGGLDLISDFRKLPRVRAPGREYLLFRGGVNVMKSSELDPEEQWPDDPQLWWPEDRAWCVATDIDLDSTYVGASTECIARLLTERDLEVVPARIEDRVDIGSDTINQ